MQLFIGGAYAGKRDAVTARFPGARWWRPAQGQALDDACEALAPDTPLVVAGLLDWLATRAMDETRAMAEQDDPLRASWQAQLEALSQAGRAQQAVVVLILEDVGRGVVPMERDKRRLRDLNGWLGQDAAECADSVWYVRHGLVRQLK